MGSTQSKLTFANHPPTIYMMVGLQGAGKTTTSGKLAGLLRKQGKKPLLVACDIYRPAAIRQLQVVGKTYDIPVFEMGDKVSPVEISQKAIEYARENRNDVILIDTAGRLHINEGRAEGYKRNCKASGDTACGRRHDRTGRGYSCRRL